jgi:hypothetical protein
MVAAHSVSTGLAQCSAEVSYLLAIDLEHADRDEHSFSQHRIAVQSLEDVTRRQQIHSAFLRRHILRADSAIHTPRRGALTSKSFTSVNFCPPPAPKSVKVLPLAVCPKQKQVLTPPLKKFPTSEATDLPSAAAVSSACPSV